jgi:3-methyladenine DNA glycosylase Mpg
MSEIYDLPERKNRLSRSFFARAAEKVAKDLLGRFLAIEQPGDKTLYARLYEIAAFEGGAASSMSKGSLYSPGTLSISTKHGKKLIDIATKEICTPSCITLIAGMVGDGTNTPQFIQGPGNLAKKLNINSDYDGLPIDISYVWLAGDSAEPEEIFKRKSEKIALNCKGYFYMRRSF